MARLQRRQAARNRRFAVGGPAAPHALIPISGATMKKILAVDDHVHIVRLIQVNLDKEFIVITAGDGEEGMERLARNGPT